MSCGLRLLSASILGVVSLLAGTDSAFAESDYILGHGQDVGDFNFAGYAAIAADVPLGHSKDLSLDDLSLYVSGHVNNWLNPFMETELSSLPLMQTPGGELRGRAVLERLYNDILLTDDLILRGGKMLAPVGEWNAIHAAPLVVTSSRPLATYYGFSEYVTGISLLYANSTSSALLPDVQVYWQPAGEFAQRTPDLTVHNYRDVSGAHLNWSFGLNDKVGASVQHSTVDATGDRQTVGGLNGNYKFGQFALESEATYTAIDKSFNEVVRSNEWGGYVLGSYAVTSTVSVITWYELFRTRYNSSQSQDVLVGASWHPSPPLVWKLEYVGSIGGPEDSNRTGFYGSLAVLF